MGGALMANGVSFGSMLKNAGLRRVYPFRSSHDLQVSVPLTFDHITSLAVTPHAVFTSSNGWQGSGKGKANAPLCPLPQMKLCCGFYSCTCRLSTAALTTVVEALHVHT